MAVEIISTTDSPEDVAAAMGAEVEKDEVEGADDKKDEKSDDKAGDKSKVTDGDKSDDKKSKDDDAAGDEKDEKDDKSADDEKGDDKDEDDDEDKDDDAAASAKPKKVTGYKRKFLKAEEENRLLLDLLKKQQKADSKTDDDDDEDDGDVKDKPPTTYSGDPEPGLEQFKNESDPYAAFTVAHSKWAMKEVEAKLRAESSANETKKARTADQSDFNSRLTEVRKNGGIYSDYDEVMEGVRGEDLGITPLMQGLIMKSKSKDGVVISVDVMHYLASNPDHTREIIAMEPAEQAAEMGVVRKLAMEETERRTKALATKKSKNSDKTTDKSDKSDAAGGDKSTDKSAAGGSGSDQPPKKKTVAPPPPIKPVGKRSAPAAQDLEAVAASGDFKSYEAQRKSQGYKYR